MDILSGALAQGLPAGIVVAIYLIIIKIIDARKDRTQLKISNELTEAVNSISNFIAGMTKNIIEKDKEKCKLAIEDTFTASAFRLIQFVQRTLLQNHLDINKESIMIDIHNIANSEYYSIFSTLNLYKINDITVSDYLDKNWIKDIETDLVDVIYNGALNNEEKIINFTNRINLKFDSHINYLVNKSLK